LRRRATREFALADAVRALCATRAVRPLSLPATWLVIILRVRTTVSAARNALMELLATPLEVAYLTTPGSRVQTCFWMCEKLRVVTKFLGDSLWTVSTLELCGAASKRGC